MWYTRPYHRRLALALLVGVAPAWSQSRLLQQGNYALPTGMGLQPQFDLEKVGKGLLAELLPAEGSP